MATAQVILSAWRSYRKDSAAWCRSGVSTQGLARGKCAINTCYVWWRKFPFIPQNMRSPQVR